MREINNRLELSEASAALVAIPRGNFTANFDIKEALFARFSDIPLLSLFLEKLTLC